MKKKRKKHINYQDTDAFRRGISAKYVNYFTASLPGIYKKRRPSADYDDLVERCVDLMDEERDRYGE